MARIKRSLKQKLGKTNKNISSFNLTNYFLIAVPTMDDPNFEKTVTYICEHNENGALGIVVNRPLDLELGEILSQMEINTSNEFLRHTPVFYGGPVNQERGFVIHKPFGKWRSSFEMSEDIVVTTSKDILQAIAESKGPPEHLVTLGHAGWSSGQLEQELARNIWLVTPAQPEILFDVSYDQRWNKAFSLLGIDPKHLVTKVGHA